MKEAKGFWRWGLSAGLAAGLLDAGLIALVEPQVSPWVLLQSFLAWLVCGWAVVATKTGLGDAAHGMLVTVLLNLPWFVALSLATGQPGHLPPLLGMSLVFGWGFGWARKRARNGLKNLALT